MTETKTKNLDPVKEIKSLLKTDKLLIGTDSVMKAIKSGSVAKVYLSLNCPEDVREKFLHYSTLAGISVMKLELPNDELGIICKKMFHVSVLGILK